MTRDFTLEDIKRVVTEVVIEAVDEKITNAITGSEARMMKRMDEKFQEAKDFADERFSWLGTRMDDTVERLEDKIDAQGIDMRNGFRDVNKKIDLLGRSHATRIDLLEQKVL